MESNEQNQQTNQQATPQAQDLPEMISNMPQNVRVVGPNERNFQQTGKDKARGYLVPIAVLVVFSLFVLLGILPNLNQIFAGISQINEVTRNTNKEIANLESLITLESTQSEIDENLVKIKKLAGDQSVSEVVKFQDKISDLAKKYGLVVKEKKTGENIVGEDDNATEQTEGLGLIEIPSQFVLEGQQTSIKAFIQALNEIDDFLVIGRMDLQLTNKVTESLNLEDSLLWKLEITLIKYQLQTQEQNRKLTDVYLGVSPLTKPNQDVLKYIEGK